MMRTCLTAACIVLLSAAQAHADAIVYDRWVGAEVTEPVALEYGATDSRHVLRFNPPLAESAHFFLTCTESGQQEPHLQATVNSGRSLMHYGGAESLDLAVKSGEVVEQVNMQPISLREVTVDIPQTVYSAFFRSGLLEVEVRAPAQRTVFAADLSPESRPMSEFMRSCGFLNLDGDLEDGTQKGGNPAA